MDKILVNEQEQIYLIKLDRDLSDFVKDVIASYKAKQPKNYEFENKFGFPFKWVISFGDPTTADHKLLKYIIPQTKQSLVSKQAQLSYKCYVNDSPTVILHECPRSSWQCLMILLNHPNEVLIYKMRSDES